MAPIKLAREGPLPQEQPYGDLVSGPTTNAGGAAVAHILANGPGALRSPFGRLTRSLTDADDARYLPSRETKRELALGKLTSIYGRGKVLGVNHPILKVGSFAKFWKSGKIPYAKVNRETSSAPVVLTH